MTNASADSSTGGDVAVTIATFPNPHEAEMARATLESQGLIGIVNNDHGQYATARSWVHLQVARYASSEAFLSLEQGPLHASEVADDADDMRPLRQRRRFIVARWFLYAGAVSLLLSGVLMPLSVVAFALALWSRQNPRTAFGAACVLQILVVLVSLATTGPSGLISLIPLFAFYIAWAFAAPEPPERLVTSPVSSTCWVAIGDSWKTAGTSSEPTERPTWVLRVLGALLLVIVIVYALSEALRFS